MKLTIRPRDPEHKLNRSVIEFAEKRFEALSQLLPDDTALIELMLEHLHRRRTGPNHYVHALIVIPGEPKTFHTEVVADDFRTALDRLYEKLEKHLRRRHRKLVALRRRGERRGLFAKFFRRSRG